MVIRGQDVTRLFKWRLKKNNENWVFYTHAIAQLRLFTGATELI